MPRPWQPRPRGVADRGFRAGTAARRPSPIAAPARAADHVGVRLGVVLGDPGPPLEVADQRGPELGIAGQPGVVGREAHQRGEAEPLLGGDPEPAVVREHRLVPAELVGVRRGTAEDLDPPGGDVGTVLLAALRRGRSGQQVVALDPVVEGVDQPAEGRLPPAHSNSDGTGSTTSSTLAT